MGCIVAVEVNVAATLGSIESSLDSRVGSVVCLEYGIDDITANLNLDHVG